ncbi:26S proteasome non-ATPase regulatory subunit [Spironucleus salmonicida]|uniref:COP9 signalosome complex subunit 5 n=1 Tax=Spironucleus salmonicida TaxID=348837 RepID=V6LPQ7_9EUKA|nr:26S proteasome non-ATPase regulatory subunit [Spironucleus salmonicida]|eukprot:EST46218.1 26S proteasome non-ATPase regulatory subunit [Spironucleus salmonicida]
MDQLMNFPGMGMPKQNTKQTDSSETVVISTIALIKMVKHAQRGIPVEVMGLCLGSFIDQYTIYITDVFAMPQIGQSDSVESIDEEYQAEMLNQLEKVRVTEKVVGWFHSHPGYHCWLSGVDQKMQQTFEQLNPRCVAIVVDPVNSANGRIELEAFRLTENKLSLSAGPDSRIATSQVGYLRKKDPSSVLHGMGSQFYQMNIQFCQNGAENTITNKISTKKWPELIGGTTVNIIDNMDKILDGIRNNDLIGVEEEAENLLDETVQGDLDLVLRGMMFS